MGIKLPIFGNVLLWKQCYKYYYYDDDIII